MTVYLLCDDLMTSSRVQGAAAVAGTTIQTCSNLSALQEALRSEGAGSKVLLDLQTKGVDWTSAIADLKPLATLLAFGPHVWKQQLDLARDAGCDHVLTNGEFFSDVGKWLR